MPYLRNYDGDAEYLYVLFDTEGDFVAYTEELEVIQSLEYPDGYFYKKILSSQFDKNMKWINGEIVYPPTPPEPTPDTDYFDDTQEIKDLKEIVYFNTGRI